MTSPRIKLRDDLVDSVVIVGSFFARTGDNQRRTGFVDQDRVDFVDDREVVAALLNAVFESNFILSRR